MDETQIPTTPNIRAAAQGLHHAVRRFLTAQDTLPILGEWESILEGFAMLSLAIRNIEGVSELARRDLVLLPAAMVMARTCFETCTTVRWMLDPPDPYEREMRWLRTLLVREEYYRRLAATIASIGSDDSKYVGVAQVLKRFHDDVVNVLPLRYKRKYQPKSLPSLRQMLQSLGQERLYLQYIIASQYAHGTQGATEMYRRHLGNMKEFGEFVTPEQWQACLTLCWESLRSSGLVFLDRAGGDPDAFASDEFAMEIASLLVAIGASPN